jgi:hypothetical protein
VKAKPEIAGDRQCRDGKWKETPSFLQKKKQKNSDVPGVVATWLPTPAISKSFLLLFFKKEALSE